MLLTNALHLPEKDMSRNVRFTYNDNDIIKDG